MPGHGGDDAPLRYQQAEVAKSVTVDADEPLDVLLLGGRPIREAIAWYGPFVMNTKQEILDAMDDFEAGRMGAIAPEHA